MTTADDLETRFFATRADLRAWLEAHHADSPGLWVRLAKAGGGRMSITFTDLLEEGLCFGWSESQRRPGDPGHYLQRFTPRKRQGTVSERNRRLVRELQERGLMTAAGLAVL